MVYSIIIGSSLLKVIGGFTRTTTIIKKKKKDLSALLVFNYEIKVVLTVGCLEVRNMELQGGGGGDDPLIFTEIGLLAHFLGTQDLPFSQALFKPKDEF